MEAGAAAWGEETEAEAGRTIDFAVAGLLLLLEEQELLLGQVSWMLLGEDVDVLEQVAVAIVLLHFLNLI